MDVPADTGPGPVASPSSQPARSPAPYPADFAERLPIGLVAWHGQTLVQANRVARHLLGAPPSADRTACIVRLGDGCSGLADLVDGARMVVVTGARLIEVERQDADGLETWFLRDVSSELRLLGQLAEQASALAFTSESFLILDQSGVVRYANEYAERERGGTLTGTTLISFERLCGAGFEDPRAQSQAEVQARLAQIVQSGATSRYNAWHRRAGGADLPVEVSLRSHRLSQETVLLLVARDESRRLLHLQALQQAKDEAESSDRAKSAFLAITSHELRTPLTGIIGFCDLLSLELAGTDQAKATEQYLKLIADSSKSLLGIINDIVDLSKIEARTLSVRMAVTDADALVAQVVAAWRDRARRKGVEVVQMPSTGRIGRFTTDPQRLRQILENLVSNAVKFTEGGSVRLTIEHSDDYLEFVIADQGCGIPEEAQPHLFKAFWQAAAHTTRAAGGNGLGLYISRNLTDLLGGRLWLAHSTDAGTTFRLRFPRIAANKTSSRIMKSDLWKVPAGGIAAANRPNS